MASQVGVPGSQVHKLSLLACSCPHIPSAVNHSAGSIASVSVLVQQLHLLGRILMGHHTFILQPPSGWSQKCTRVNLNQCKSDCVSPLLTMTHASRLCQSRIQSCPEVPRLCKTCAFPFWPLALLSWLTLLQLRWSPYARSLCLIAAPPFQNICPIYLHGLLS
jgi:hypothetical protein